MLWTAVSASAWAQASGMAPAAPAQTAAKTLAKSPALPAAEKEEPLIVQVYNVIDLVAAKPPYVFRAIQVPAVTVEQGSPFGGMGGAGGGAMYGGGMGGMGGGMMMGAGMAGGMGMPGMGPEPGMAGAPGMPGAAPPQKPQQKPAAAQSRSSSPQTSALPPGWADMEDIIDVIQNTVDATTWDRVGGPGSIGVIGGRLLVINQTAAVHKKIEKLLEDVRAEGNGQRSVTVRAAWLFLDLKQLIQLSKPQSTDASMDRAALDELAAKVKGYHGQITCFEGQTVHIVSGCMRSLVLSAIPVVGGGNEVGYQPQTVNPLSGAVLQVTTSLLPKAQGAIIDVHSQVTRTEPQEPSVFSTYQAPGAKPAADAKYTSPSSRMGLSLDRLRLATQHLATTLRVPLAKPVLVGGLTMEPGAASEQDAAGAPQLYLFVEVTAQ